MPVGLTQIALSVSRMISSSTSSSLILYLRSRGGRGPLSILNQGQGENRREALPLEGLEDLSGEALGIEEGGDPDIGVNDDSPGHPVAGVGLLSPLLELR